MYADMQAKAQAEAAASGAGPSAGGAQEAPAKEKDMGNVVDAEFTEVKDKK
jgi:molecular chaperone DnaK